jgi:lipopolysaccharide/colanic/teichoic acid biosynthesis glycosyltransferase
MKPVSSAGNRCHFFLLLRHLVKPGITGWAQVNYRYGAGTDDAVEKLRYDLYYIKNYSLVLDVEILLKTILKVCSLGGK